MERPSIRQLEYLVAVADHLNFREAAASCNVTQPALSTQLQQLEALLGVQLFERDTRRVVATAAGLKLAQEARGILSATDHLLDSARAAGEPLSGRLRLGVIPTVAPYLLPSVVQATREAHPGLVLLLQEDQTDRIVQRLHSGELDLLLLALDVDLRGAAELALFSDPFVLACPTGHPLASREVLAESDLDGESVLLLEEGHCLREHALEACKLRDSQITVPYQATSLATVVQMVANGIGITLLPGMAVAAGIATNTSLAVRPFDQANVTRQIGLMWRKKTPRRVEFRQLGELIAELVNC